MKVHCMRLLVSSDVEDMYFHPTCISHMQLLSRRSATISISDRNHLLTESPSGCLLSPSFCAAKRDPCQPVLLYQQSSQDPGVWSGDAIVQRCLARLREPHQKHPHGPKCAGGGSPRNPLLGHICELTTPLCCTRKCTGIAATPQDCRAFPHYLKRTSEQLDIYAATPAKITTERTRRLTSEQNVL